MLVERQDGSFDTTDVSLDSHGSMIIGITSSFMILAVSSVLARFYVKAFMLSTLGIDDWIILAAAVCSITVLVCIIEEVKLGVGEHFGNPHQLANFEKILHYSYFHGWIIVTGISSVKISVGFFLLRLIQNKWFKVSI
jgi:hypothetical protein